MVEAEVSPATESSRPLKRCVSTDAICLLDPTKLKGLSRDELEAEVLRLRAVTLKQEQEQEQEVEFQKNLLRSVGQAVICTDLASTITYWNRAASSMYGWSEEEAIGASILSLLKPAGQFSEEMGMQIFQDLSQGKQWSGEYAIYRRDGHCMDILVTDTPIMDEEGKLVGVIGVSTDISELKRKEGQILQLNAELEERVAQRTRELHESNDRLRAEVQDHLRAKEDLQRLFQEMEASKVKIESQARNLEKLVEALHEARREAESASRLKSRFLAHMSHEIRTPMNGVIGMTNLILATDLTDEQREFVRTIQTSGDALLSVINDILDFSKIEAGELVVEYLGFSFHHMMEDAIDLFAMKAREKGVELVCHLDQSVPDTVYTDPNRLRQVIVNLVSNAIKFTETGEVVVRAEAAPWTRPTPQWGPMDGRQPLHELHVSVKDTGIGIPLERVDRLFKPFSQLDASTTRKFGGTGLGLVISKQLVEHLGGGMWVRSEGLGQGSTFHFTITLYATDTPAPEASMLPPGGPSGRHHVASGKRHLSLPAGSRGRSVRAKEAEGTWRASGGREEDLEEKGGGGVGICSLGEEARPTGEAKTEGRGPDPAAEFVSAETPSGPRRFPSLSPLRAQGELAREGALLKSVGTGSPGGGPSGEGVPGPAGGGGTARQLAVLGGRRPCPSLWSLAPVQEPPPPRHLAEAPPWGPASSPGREARERTSLAAARTPGADPSPSDAASSAFGGEVTSSPTRGRSNGATGTDGGGCMWERGAGAGRAFPRLHGEMPSGRGRRQVLLQIAHPSVRSSVSDHLCSLGLEPVDPPPEEGGQEPPGRRHYVAAIIDLQGEDGDAAAGLPPLARTPLILLCPYGVRKQMKGNQEGQLVAVLSKPVRQSQLTKAIQDCLEMRPGGVLEDKIELPELATVPMEEGPQSPAAPAPERGPLPKTPSRQQKQPAMADKFPLKILVVEDNVVNQRVASCMLRQLGYKADLACNGAEALEALQRQRYDLAFMDVQMPVMDGIEATKRINATWQPEDRPRIVAMTANVLHSDRQLCFTVGMDAFIPKPIRKSDLLAVLETTLANAKGRSKAIHQGNFISRQPAVLEP